MIGSTSVSEMSALVAATQKYVDTIRVLMDLSDWTVRVGDKRLDDEGALAEIHFRTGLRDAAMRLSPEFYKLTADEQRSTIVHELVHIHLRPMVEVMDSMSEVLGQQAHAILCKMHENAHEYATDAMALVIARAMPLPKIRLPK